VLTSAPFVSCGAGRCARTLWFGTEDEFRSTARTVRRATVSVCFPTCCSEKQGGHTPKMRGIVQRVSWLVLALGALVAPIPVTPSSAQSIASWRDPSPHQARFVTVDSEVRLEVLDWGGVGRPVLFVGCYLTGHVYDNIAPKLTDHFHVYAVTRRGVGTSDHPATG